MVIGDDEEPVGSSADMSNEYKKKIKSILKTKQPSYSPASGADKRFKQP